jgi:hypothetical protein
VIATAFVLAAALSLPPPLHGDFDRDGKPDTAQIERSASGGLQLVVRPGAPSTPALVESLHTADGDIFLDLASAGSWPTACAKGLGRASDPCPRKVVVTRGGELTFGTREATLWVLVWDGRRFETIPLSD